MNIGADEYCSGNNDYDGDGFQYVSTVMMKTFLFIQDLRKFVMVLTTIVMVLFVKNSIMMGMIFVMMLAEEMTATIRTLRQIQTILKIQAIKLTMTATVLSMNIWEKSFS